MSRKMLVRSVWGLLGLLLGLLASPIGAQQGKLCLTQLAILMDGSSSISYSDFQLEKEGLARAIEDPAVVPHGGVVELTVIQFGSTTARVEIAPTVIDSDAEAASIATTIRSVVQMGGLTPMAAAIRLATDQITRSPYFPLSDLQLIIVATDGMPTWPSPDPEAEALKARDEAVQAGIDELDAIAIGYFVDPSYLASLVYPQPGVIIPPGSYEPGFVRIATDFADFVDALRDSLTNALGRIPVITDFKINDGATSTNSRDVVLTLTAERIDQTTEMRFSNTGEFAEDGSDYVPFTDTVNWTLEPGEGWKTVYAQLRNEGRCPSSVASARIFLDVPPTLLRAEGIDDTHVRLYFDQALDPTTATVADNYTLDPQVTVSQAVLTDNNRIVILTTQNILNLGQTYTVTVQNVADPGGQAILTQPPSPDEPAPNQAQFFAKWIAPKAAWPQLVSGLAFAPVTLAEVDGNPGLEVIAASLDGVVFVWHILRDPTGFIDARQVVGWPRRAGTGLQSSPAVGDVDNDGRAEIVVASNDLRVYAWNHDGSDLAGWEGGKPIDAPTGASPTLADVDGDGVLEIIVGTRSGRLYVWDGDGQLVQAVWEVDSGPHLGTRWPLTLGGAISSACAAGDLDGDGVDEIVVAADDGRVYAFNGDGTPLVGWEGGLPTESGVPFEFSSPIIANLDADGTLEVAIGARDGRIYAWNHDGSRVVSFGQNGVLTTGVNAHSSLAVGDVDNDGQMEIVVGTDTTYTLAFELTGVPVPQYPKEVGGSQLRGAPLIADLGWEPGAEVIVATATGRIKAWNGRTLNEIPGWRDPNFFPNEGPGVFVEEPIQAVLALGDLDADGRAELVAGADKVYVWDIGPGTFVPERTYWPMFAHDPRHTGNPLAQPAPTDVKPPRLFFAKSIDGTHAQVVFNEQVARVTAGEAANYRILKTADNTELSIRAVNLPPAGEWDQRTVVLETANQEQDAEYRVEARNIQDLIGNLTSVPSTTNFRGIDTKPPVLVSARALDSSHVEVVFDEAMDPITTAATRNYTIRSPLSSLTVISAELQEDERTVHLTTSVQSGTERYTLTVEGVTDKAGNPLVGRQSREFQGKESIPPQVVRAEVVDSENFRVVFSELVTSKTAKALGNYRVTGGLSVVSVTPEEEQTADGVKATSQVVVRTTPPQTPGVTYTVTVTGVTDLAGNVIVGNNTATFTGIDTIPPTVVRAQAIDSRHVNVLFSEPVLLATAIVAGNYSIVNVDDPTQTLFVEGAVLGGDVKTVTLTTAQQSGEVTYQVTVTGVTDVAGNAVEPGPSARATFMGFAEETTPPRVEEAKQVAETTIEVRFNKDLDQASAETITNYEFTPSLEVRRAILQTDLRTVRLFTIQKTAENTLYTLTVRNVRDRSGNLVDPGANTAEFRSFTAPPEVRQAERIDNTHVRVTFNEPVKKDSAEGPSNYVFTPPLEVKTATLLADEVTVELATAPQQESTTYTVRVRYVLDLANNEIVAGQNDTAQFTVPGVPPVLTGAQRLDDTRLNLVFNEPLAAESVTTPPANYEFARQLEAGGWETVPEMALRAVLLGDQRTVQLITSVQAEDATYRVTVRGVTDVAGNLIEDDGVSNVVTFTTPRVLPEAPKGVQATPTEESIILTWERSSEADVAGYHLYRATSLAQEFQRLATVEGRANTRYEDRTARPAVRYYYKVSAYDEHPAPNEGTLSVAVTAMIADTLAPRIVHAPPAAAALGEPLEIKATVTDNGEVGQVRLFYRSEVTADFASLVMIPGVEAHAYQATIPGTAVTGRQLEYYLEARDKAQPAPNVTTLPADLRGGGFRLPFYALLRGAVETMAGRPLANVTVTLLQGTTEIESTQTDTWGNFVFSRVVPGAYQVRAAAAGYIPRTVSVSLSSGEETPRRSVVVVLAPAPQFAVPLDLISFPLLFPEANVGAILAGEPFYLSAYDVANNRYLTYPDSPLFVESGRGYWLRTENTAPQVVQEGTPPPADEPVVIELLPGWNLIGDPYPFPITLGHLRVKLPGQSNSQALSLEAAAQRGWVANYAWDFVPDSGLVLVAGLDLVQTFPNLGLQGYLRPWEGYWLRAFRTVKLLFDAQPATGARQEELTVKARHWQPDQWAIPLVASVNGLVDAFNFAGVSGGTRGGWQLESPPPIAPFVDLSFCDAQGRHYAVDLRPHAGAQMAWEVVVETDQPSAEVTLTWPDLTTLPAGYQAFLTDLEAQRTQSLRTTQRYTYRSGPEGGRRHFRLTVGRGSAGRLQITGFMVRSGGRGTGGGTTTLTFVLSAPAAVSARVYSLSGRLVATLASRRVFPAGLGTLGWDGRDDTGRLVPAGGYVCEIVAVAETGETVRAVRTMQR